MKGHENGIPSTELSDDHSMAILGHELRNVLNGLLGMAELLRRSSLTTEQGRWLKAIEHSGRQMESLIRSGPRLSGSSQPAMDLPGGRVDGVEILEQLVISQTPAAFSRQNRLFLVVQEELPRFWSVDACLVRQLLENLVGNAIKFTQSGEIALEALPVFGDGGPEGAVRFRVRDTGPGIEAIEARHLFNAYRRCNNSPEGEVVNRGLGLFICRRIVHVLGGRISCSSPAGGGAQFEVILPGILRSNETAPSMLRSNLLDQTRCELQLAGTLRSCIASILARLGVKISDREADLTGHDLFLSISEAPRKRAEDPAGILFQPARNSVLASREWYLEAPFLESSLGAMLLEIALERQSQVLMNGNPDSAPRQR